MSGVYVLGAGGHAKVIVRLLQELGYSIAAIYDDDPELAGTMLLGYPVLGPIARLEEWGTVPAVIAIGSNAARKALAERYQCSWMTLIHPRALVDNTAQLGRGTVILAGAVVQADSHVGRHAIINTAASVDHDCWIGDYTHVGPGSCLAGGVFIEEGGFVGTGVSAIPGARVGAWSTVGAGAVVIDEIPKGVVAVGAPARTKPSRNGNGNGAKAVRLVTQPRLPSNGVARTVTDKAPSPAALLEQSSAGPPRIHLSPPHMSPAERELLLEAFDSNWIAPMGPHVDAFERELAAKVQMKYAVALSSGTAALHLALVLLNVQPGDEVVTSTLTFAAPTNVIRYVGAQPVFIDSESSSWNMDPGLLAEELESSARSGRRLKAVIAVDVFGQCADYEPIRNICHFYEIPLIEDAAEALGATYRGRPAGSLGDIGCFSFNGNKIITTSGGGMLVTNREDWARRARSLAAQAKDPAPHYEHSEVGYNYRLSNLLAAVGRGQLRVLDERIARRRANFDFYRQALGQLPGIIFMPELPLGRSNRWLTCILVDPDKFGATRADIQACLARQNIESRPVWKPMHMQPVYRHCRARGGSIAEQLFTRGLCLPSGSNLKRSDLKRIVETICSVGRFASEPIENIRSPLAQGILPAGSEIAPPSIETAKALPCKGVT